MTDFTLGAASIQMAPAEIVHGSFHRGFAQKTSPVPKDARGAVGGVVSYRLFYDGPGNRAAVMRNGVLVAEWQPHPGAMSNAFRVWRVCLDRVENIAPLRVHALRVQPWDGTISPNSDAPATRQVLSAPNTARQPGTLDAVTLNDVTFSGTKKSREAGMFIRFPNKPAALADADALLMLGKRGEVGAADLEVRDGKARARTAFAKSIELPLETIEQIAFTPRDAPLPEPADAMVLKNCDELRGSLLKASTGAPLLRWKMRSGQEVNIAPGRIASVRIGTGIDQPPRAAAATLELRNGDRLRGEVTAFDEQRIDFKSAQFGTPTIAREKLRALDPAQTLLPWDGGADPDSWLGIDWREGRVALPGMFTRAHDAASWICMDGWYVPRQPGEKTGPNRTLPPGVERYELRFTATDLTGRPPAFAARLMTEDETASATFRLSALRFSVITINEKTPAMPNRPWASLPEAALKDFSSRVSMRLLVDVKAGTAAVFANNTFVVKIGLHDVAISGIGQRFSISPSSYRDSSAMISNVWLGPWNGEKSAPDNEPATLLANGDTVHGTPTAFREGAYAVATELGAIDVPAAKLMAIDFAGGTDAAKTPARIRFVDGSVMSVEGFDWDGRELRARSAVLGELRVPASGVSELIWELASRP